MAAYADSSRHLRPQVHRIRGPAGPLHRLPDPTNSRNWRCRGHRVAEVLTEAHSAKAPGRPVFGDLMRRIHRGEIARCSAGRWTGSRGTTSTTAQCCRPSPTASSTRRHVRPHLHGDGNDRFIGNFELGMATKYIDDLRAEREAREPRALRARLAQLQPAARLHR